ncbi:unnamed protein product [Angiostrongylus costaricensis]|uniref:ZT_dimer domain-containing protein n=1 Tax=Angiostrongylus costaricensis TaxID=334426 RepID=A0A0R3PBD6_ANGCS|nr:unnamed protein product [Angiostrongylus costaricensis]
MPLLDKGVQTMVILMTVNLSNIFLVVIKAIAAYHTGSFSIANSTIETFGDVFVGFLLLVQRIQARVLKAEHYPRGRTTESLTNDIDRFVEKRFDPHMELEDILVVALNILLKLFLLGICYVRRDVCQIRILLRDQGVDVITNTTAIVFVLLTRYLHKNWDIVGAATIFITICRSWLPILFSNCSKIHGVVAKPTEIDQIQEVIGELGDINAVHNLIAYHRGQGIVVELYAELKGSCSQAIEEARKRATLQLEEIDLVETAYVFHSQSYSKEPSNKNIKHTVDAEYDVPLVQVT